MKIAGDTAKAVTEGVTLSGVARQELRLDGTPEKSERMPKGQRARIAPISQAKGRSY